MASNVPWAKENFAETISQLNVSCGWAVKSAPTLNGQSYRDWNFTLKRAHRPRIRTSEYSHEVVGTHTTTKPYEPRYHRLRTNAFEA